MEVSLHPEVRALPKPGTKRSAVSIEPLAVKRARGNNFDSDSDTSASDCEPSGDSSCTTPNHVAGSIATTPLTPSSPKLTSQYPSDLNKSYHCPFEQCGKSFNRPAKLAQHVRSHTNTRLFVCPHTPCTKDFLRESHLQHHIKSAHSGVRDYVCDWKDCKKRFITATRLRRHHAAHEGREKFRCTNANCGQTFRKHGTLQKHIKTVHEGKDPFQCTEVNDDGQVCGAGFVTEGKLKSHAGRVHATEIGTKVLICTMCSFGADRDHPLASEHREMIFSSHASLQSHLISEHPPTCTECGLKCTSQSALKSHIEVIHGDLSIDERRTHICPELQCGQGFTKLGNLNAHIQITHKGKRFICGAVDPKTLSHIGDWDGSNACGASSTSKRNLERHIQAAHLGLEYLGKYKKKERRSGGRPSSLDNRTTVFTRLTGAGYEEHSGRKILCVVSGCDYRFGRDYDLEMHLQARHGLTDADIQVLLIDKDSDSRQVPKSPFYDGAGRGFGAPDGLDLRWCDDIEMNDCNEPFETLLDDGDRWLSKHSDPTSSPGDAWWHHNGMVLKDNGDTEMIDPTLS